MRAWHLREADGMDTTTMQALVARAQAGDRAAFGELYEQLAPKILNYLYYRTGGDRDVAEDLTEDVFSKVLEKLDRYEDRGQPFAAWVYRVAHNRLVDHFRRQPKQPTVRIEDCYNLSEGGAETVLDTALTQGILAKALRQLTEDQRQAVVLRFLQGLTVLETAAVIGKTEDAVKKLQARGLRSLSRSLGGRAEFARWAA
jgi:RNA polymerase sigma-70 factor (ECF subfamily)